MYICLMCVTLSPTVGIIYDHYLMIMMVMYKANIGVCRGRL